MTSSPPGARDTAPPALPRLATDAFRARAADEPVLFVCVEAAPPEACRTHVGADGSLSFETHLAGRVVAAGPDGLTLEMNGRAVLVRYLLPSALDLGALHGSEVHIDLAQRYCGPGRATIDTQIRDARGTTLLWARDGRIPEDRSAHGLALRVAFAEGGHRLCVAPGGGGVTCVGAGEVAHVRAAESYTLAVLRVGADDVSFVLIQR